MAKRAFGFEMRVIAYDVFKDEMFAQKLGITYLTLEEVLSESYFLSIHVPLSSSTRRLIGEKELRFIKDEAFLVNISRGDIVDEEALYRVLKEGKLGGLPWMFFTRNHLRGTFYSLWTMLL